ncbi:Tumor necrosis factor [Dissostichus eleginoides]|uniref:Tumor necrosis factor n=1 Tax=Dissostichus eleginoides TaxID=100907 RepID=A0AAD9F080_DISEL|nr:Tumor necrosis factor [Dissostichus eleginoides]
MSKEISPEGKVITWESEFEPANNVTPYIVIPEDGFYFVYLNFAILCVSNHEGANFKPFVGELHRYSEGYDDPQSLTVVRDHLRCDSLQYRNVFVGQLFKLSKKDRLSVLIKEGFELIDKSKFGAYLVERICFDDNI